MAEVDNEQGASAIRRNLRFETAQELFDGIPEISEDVTARPAGEEAMAFAVGLVSSPTPEEAITVCAYNLPRRFAVWWGHECLKRVTHLLDATDEYMLDLAAQWVANPDEDMRYNALDAAVEARAKTPGVWIALAAGWSGGSMVGPDLPPVPPSPHLTAKAVNAGVLSVLARVEIGTRVSTMGSFVRMADQLARDG